MKELDSFKDAEQELCRYFGYAHGWRVFPWDDRREMYWWCDGDAVGFAADLVTLRSRGELYYEDSVYTYRHLAKHIYEGHEYTMILCDTNTDFNVFLAVFDNAKRTVRMNEDE